MMKKVSRKNLIDVIYPEFTENAEAIAYMTNRAILATKNEYVDKSNEKIIKFFPS